MKTKHSKLPRSVLMVGWVSFWADVSSEMAYPLLPMFLVGTLAAPRAVLGLVEGAGLAAVAVMQYWGGQRADRTGRRVVMIRWGYGLPVLGKMLVAAAVGWPMVLAGRMVDRIGKGLRASPRDALIADLVSAADRGRAFGLHRAMDNAGAFIGVLTATALLWWFDRGGDANEVTVRTVFWIAAAAALVALGVTFALKEPKRTDAAHGHHHAHAAKGSAASPLALARPLGRVYWLNVSVLTLFGLANSSDAFLLLRVHETGWPAWVVSAAYATYMLTAAAFAYPAGLLSDRHGRWPVLAIGWAIYSAVYFGFAFASPAGLWPLLAIYGLSVALTEGVGKALLADCVSEGQRGRAMGIFGLLNGGAVLVGSLAAGWLWDRYGAVPAFAIPGAIAGLAAVAMVGMGLWLRPRRRASSMPSA